MIGRARTGIGRVRRTVVRSAVTAAVLCVVAGHATLAAAFAPQEQPQEPATATLTADFMKAEIHAPTEGRSDREVLEKYLAHYAQMGRPIDPTRPGWWITDQETVVSAAEARLDGNVLVSTEFLMSLPEGSKLRAVFVGREVIIAPGEKGMTMTLRDGKIRIIDPGGVTRVTVHCGISMSLKLEASLVHGEFGFRLWGESDREQIVPVRIEVDTETGRPEGETQPPHGVNRWQLQTPEEPNRGPYRLKMQWIYDLYELNQSVERTPAAR